MQARHIREDFKIIRNGAFDLFLESSASGIMADRPRHTFSLSLSLSLSFPLAGQRNLKITEVTQFYDLASCQMPGYSFDDIIKNR
jgi:hypothetical protein